MSIVHIPFYPSDWLAGTRGMSDAETGVYITLFCLCAESPSSHGLIFDSNKSLSKACGTTKKKFKASLKHLLDTGLVYEHCGGLGVRRVDAYVRLHRKGLSRPAIPLSIRQQVYDRDGAVCAYCGDSDCDLHIDHIYPWSRGGTHALENLTLACPPCNMSKGAKTLDEWGGRK